MCSNASGTPELALRHIAPSPQQLVKHSPQPPLLPRALKTHLPRALTPPTHQKPTTRVFTPTKNPNQTKKTKGVGDVLARQEQRRRRARQGGRRRADAQRHHRRDGHLQGRRADARRRRRCVCFLCCCVGWGVWRASSAAAVQTTTTTTTKPHTKTPHNETKTPHKTNKQNKQQRRTSGCRSKGSTTASPSRSFPASC